MSGGLTTLTAFAALALVAPECVRLYRKYGLVLALSVGVWLMGIAYIWLYLFITSLWNVPITMPTPEPENTVFRLLQLAVPPLICWRGLAAVAIFFIQLMTDIGRTGL